MSDQGTKDDPILLITDAAGVRTLTLNRPKARNALSVGLMAALQEALNQAREDESVKVVVLAANGPAFCAGHDLKEVRATPTRDAYETLFKQCSELMTSIVRLPKPVIAKVHAMATAAGCQLVASCDLAVAAKDARFATPGVNIGLFCSTPMVALSRNVPRKKAMEMLLTGHPISAEEALAHGLLNTVVEADALDSTVAALAETIASKSPLTLAIGKEAFYRQLEMPLDEAYLYASEVMTRNMMARDAEEGIDAFLSKRAPSWTGR
ncbi:enoyl-CoA hydratase [Rhodospirillum sp. A1_3_36]|uniref:enoyl-CoA hydratase n=1 Tax=Rhodospirillum sp. A1_3_36 TaxID=3391666 RepID=UPI0039A67A27